ncbi:MAG: tRNA uridine-5-carboxymethylaminomethyl(34) synthesis GTPase MnmE [Verrucomicrobiales bacterium]|nr:tRNA uridine-5-carboxymethylaminomethyl(34) synthesis GTPase MnmE [Verrucomicrobiales bacterium]MEC7882488.1 tRNA uridine-5-carboxymethylaminomethyl(34) synthesis GTPase MnmE [Verrucomicrobiota bacterium]
MPPIRTSMVEDTIAAIATPLGQGGIAIIRISGENAVSIGDNVFRSLSKATKHLSSAKSHTIHYGHIVHNDQLIDEVMVSIMRSPATFTREDIIEINCHGGMQTTKSVLDAVLDAGARLATPGEFTKRAFIHGRIDLTQAEAVSDLINARTNLALNAANEQLAGKLSKRIDQLRDDTMQVLAHIEAHIDFPDEDIEPDTMDGLVQRLKTAKLLIDQLLATANDGQLIRKGIRVAIIGRPNAGKSSLLNQLLGHDRAIVSNIAGTTRDTISEEAQIRGIPVVFIDTAGLQETDDKVEQEGVNRSRASLNQADLILHVIDASEPLTSDSKLTLTELADRNCIVVLNKNDLSPELDHSNINSCHTISVSSITGNGIESLKDAIRVSVWDGEVTSEMLEVMINSRHQEALNRAKTSLEAALSQLQSGLTLDLIAVDLRISTNAIGEIVGKTTTEDLLDSIFSTFCIGK